MADPNIDLVDVPQAKVFLNLKDDKQDQLVADTITRVSKSIEAWCRRPLARRTFTAYRFQGPSGLIWRPPGPPIDVTSAITISVGTTAQTVWRTEADGDPEDWDVIVGSTDPRFGLTDHFYRSGGWCEGQGRNPYNVLATFTAGFSPIPEDLQEAALEIIQKVFMNATKQLGEVVSVSGPAGSITLLDTDIPRRARRLIEAYSRWEF